MGQRILLLEHSHLIEEDDYYAHRTHKTNSKEPQAEECSMKSTPISELIVDYLPWHIPSHKHRCEQRPHRHEDVGGQVVAATQEVDSEDVQLYGTARQGAEYSDDDTERCLHASSFLA